MSQATMPETFTILSQRSQYQSCHINVPDLDQPIAAIEFNQNFYSFFQSIPDSNKTLSVATRLTSKGERLVITQLKKGYGVWIHEPEARLEKKKQRDRQAKSIAPCKLFTSRQQYQVRDILVPDVDLPLPGLVADGESYSMFKMTTNTAEVLDLVAKITQRGEGAVIIDFKNIFLVCVSEPEAKALESVSVSRDFLESESKLLQVAS
jgi:hypothetical protein